MQCKKVKNSCKICFDHVSKKTGLQCQGACQKWAHYKCLNYTPGKIHDIKTGVIKVTCPCPDCNTTSPKEELINPPYSCNNSKCPANKLPVCNSRECPVAENPIPIYPAPPAYSPILHDSSCSPGSHMSLVRTISPPCPAKRRGQGSPKKCPSPNCRVTKKVGNSNPCSPKGSKSFSTVMISGTQYDPIRTTASDTKLKSSEDQRVIITAIQNLSDTVTQLSQQLKDLMSQIAP